MRELLRRKGLQRPLHAALFALLTLPACATTSQFNALETRVSAVERADEQRRQQLTEAVDNATRQVRTLNEQLEQARAQTRTVADLGARLEGIDEQLRSLNGSMAEMRRTVEAGGTDLSAFRSSLLTQLTQIERRITEVERRVGLAPAVDPNQIPTSNADVMTQARQALQSRDYNRARALANALLQRAPQDALADDARLLIGRSYSQENRFATAIQEFQRILNDYPSGDTVPDALTDMSEAFVRLGMCVPAQRTLQQLIDRHGSTPQGQAARTRLQEIRRLPRTTCTG